MSVVNLDSSVLLGYYMSQHSASLANQSTAPAKTSAASTTGAKSATANDVTPWSIRPAAQETRDADVLNLKKFIDLSKVPVLAGKTTDSKTEQDNQKLFALYNAVNNLSYLATMSKREGTSAGLMAGYNTRFQAGLKEIQDFITNAHFNNLTLQSGAATSSVTSTAKIPNATFGYTTASLVKNADLKSALPGVSATDKFTISVTKAKVTTDVTIDLSKVSGGLTLDNIAKYINQQLAASGFTSRFKRVLTQGQIDKPDKAYWGLTIENTASESLTLSSAGATPALYVAGTTGLTKAVSSKTGDMPADNQGRLIKLTDLADPRSEFTVNAAPSSGTTTAQATAVDANGDIYVVGSATGDFGSQFNAGDQDAYLTKYDSTGAVIWTRMLGSAGSASGASLALNPNGGVTVVGNTNTQLSPTAIANGNQDSFVARYDADGTMVWETQIQTRNKNTGNAVNVDSAGNVYLSGQTTGAIGKGQVKIGGSDCFITKLDNKGKVVYQQQFGSTANDSVAATALTGTGDLVVASVQNGHAILSKYAGGDARTAPLWQMDLGDLQAGGSITGLAVSGDKVYVTGSTQNTALTGTGAVIAQASKGGSDAYVFAATDNGNSLTADRVSYLGTSAIDKGGAVTVGPDGTVYVAGTTAGTFAGQTRTTQKTDNMFVAALNAGGTTNWVRQYGGLEGQSIGTGIAVDPNGSSVLDALGLPTGKLALSRSADLLSATTLRPGDSFKLKIDSTYDRTATITIEKGETLQSLVTKLNGQLFGAGKASIVYGGGGSALKLEVKAGVTTTLIAGPANLDALKSLGLQPGMLTGGVSTDQKTAKTDTSAGQTFGLGLNPKLSIATTANASVARAQLLSVLTVIQKAYQTTNNPLAATSATGNSDKMSGTATAYTQSKLANYTVASGILDSTTYVLG